MVYYPCHQTFLKKKMYWNYHIIFGLNQKCLEFFLTNVRDPRSRDPAFYMLCLSLSSTVVDNGNFCKALIFLNKNHISLKRLQVKLHSVQDVSNKLKWVPARKQLFHSLNCAIYESCTKISWKYKWKWNETVFMVAKLINYLNFISWLV